MCTSFVSYFNQPLYGMNFDFWELPIKLKIDIENKVKIFSMDVFLGGKWLLDMAMNESGLFGNFQSNWSENHLFIPPGADQIPVMELFEMMMRDAKSVNDVKSIIASKTVVHNALSPDSEHNKIHNMISDKFGEAMIIESRNYQNDITTIGGKYMVMTNFPNGEFKNKHYSEVKHINEDRLTGYDRYRNVCEYIWNNRDNFCLAKAFEPLKITSSKGDTWETLISTVFDPLRLEIFLAVKRDFDHLWRVSLKDGILTAYSGFKEAKNINLNMTEILVSDL